MSVVQTVLRVAPLNYLVSSHFAKVSVESRFIAGSRGYP
jgi:hypothetical protein